MGFKKKLWEVKHRKDRILTYEQAVQAREFINTPQKALNQFEVGAKIVAESIVNQALSSIPMHNNLTAKRKQSILKKDLVNILTVEAQQNGFNLGVIYQLTLQGNTEGLDAIPVLSNIVKQHLLDSRITGLKPGKTTYYILSPLDRKRQYNLYMHNGYTVRGTRYPSVKDRILGGIEQAVADGKIAENSIHTNFEFRIAGDTPSAVGSSSFLESSSSLESSIPTFDPNLMPGGGNYAIGYPTSSTGYSGSIPSSSYSRSYSGSIPSSSHSRSSSFSSSL